jgi:FkbM family methyltransferase
MPQPIKKALRRLLTLPLTALKAASGLYGGLLALVRPGWETAWHDEQANRASTAVRTVTRTTNEREVRLTFHTPNAMCRFRVETFSTKEPETLDWIDRHGGAGAFFDIGANVGLYTVYYAATQQGTVYAFEPSVFNLALLARNIDINNLSDRVRLVANPLTDRNQFAHFNLSTREEGGALSGFGVDYGHDGTPLTRSFSYQTLGFSLDTLFSGGLLTEYPVMVKLDVDGIEHLILAGAVNTLRNPVCRTVLVEVSHAFADQAEGVAQLLTGCGFALVPQPGMGLERERKRASSVNQIWIKS